MSDNNNSRRDRTVGSLFPVAESENALAERRRTTAAPRRDIVNKNFEVVGAAH
jgi:hypothetical protein